ncbi:hypothetical protein AZE42_13063 [Rhizopogon vesiculosus]|uniref:Major facilitator superfamily (MFS) profile domain-containing protein n=1 Tax=Rhizopogon vesiculosus TaxID=180088 RepID=A0A1J8PXS0_9AGAM|nr:hypothetical protein AZE42_13063 [Rhizopogon vesiculosus]
MYKIPLHVSCCFAVLGNIAYALAYRINFLYLILIRRCLSGVSFSMFMYCKRYCSGPRVVGIRRRTTFASWLVICQGLGMSLGPFLGGLLHKIGLSNLIFNGYTSPGWVMAGIFVGFWALAATYFEDIPQSQTILKLWSATDSKASVVVDEATGQDTELPTFLSSPSTPSPSPIDESSRAQLSLITRSQ